MVIYLLRATTFRVQSSDFLAFFVYGAKILQPLLLMSNLKLNFQQLGAKWNNLGDSLGVLTAFSISDVMLMLFVDIFIYGLLTW